MTQLDLLSFASQAALWLLVLTLGFLVVGLIRQLGLLSWRLEQLQATTPTRLGRDGLPPGVHAPDFKLADVAGDSVSLRDFAGRKALLVFLQPGCGPCGQVVPVLNELEETGELQVVAVSNGEPESSRAWAEEHDARFPVLCQERWKVSRKYEVFATPFAFLVDEEGVIAQKGIVNNSQHVRFLLDGARKGAEVA